MTQPPSLSVSPQGHRFDSADQWSVVRSAGRKPQRKSVRVVSEAVNPLRFTEYKSGNIWHHLYFWKFLKIYIYIYYIILYYIILYYIILYYIILYYIILYINYWFILNIILCKLLSSYILIDITLLYRLGSQVSISFYSSIEWEAETSRSNSTSRFLVQCSFLEIYNEVWLDGRKHLEIAEIGMNLVK